MGNRRNEEKQHGKEEPTGSHTSARFAKQMLVRERRSARTLRTPDYSATDRATQRGRLLKGTAACLVVFLVCFRYRFFPAAYNTWTILFFNFSLSVSPSTSRGQR